MKQSVTIQRRLIIILSIISVYVLGLIMRLGYLQIVGSEELVDKAEALWSRELPIEGQRGLIYDRNHDIIVENDDKPWNWQRVSSRKDITWDIIKNNPDIPWYWRNISKHPNITMEIIENNPEYNWEYKCGISSNPNLTIEFIEKNIEKDWDFGCHGLSKSPCITIDFVKK